MINLNRYKRKRAEIKSRSAGAIWRPKTGTKSRIRLFTFKHVVAQVDFTLGRYTAADRLKVGMEQEELDCPVQMHRTGEGDTICLRMLHKACPMCEEAARYGSKGDAWKLQARHSHLLNVVDVDEQEPRVRIWPCPSSVFSAILAYVTDEEYRNLYGCNGRDFTIDYDSNRDPTDMYQVTIRDAERSKPLQAALERKVVDLMASPDWMPPEVAQQAAGGSTRPAEPTSEVEDPELQAAVDKGVNGEDDLDDIAHAPVSVPTPAPAPRTRAVGKPKPKAKAKPRPKPAKEGLMAGQTVQFESEDGLQTGKVSSLDYASDTVVVTTDSGEEWEMESGAVQGVVKTDTEPLPF